MASRFNSFASFASSFLPPFSNYLNEQGYYNIIFDEYCDTLNKDDVVAKINNIYDNEIELSDDLLTLMVDVEMIKNYTVVNDRDNER